MRASARPRTTHTLTNGLRVIVEEDHLTPAAAVNLWYGVGSRHEKVGRTGLAHLFEHLMYQGSANVASGEHFASLDALGSQLNATTAQDRTNYFQTVPLAGLDLALWLESDRMSGLLDALDQTNLDNQRDVVRNERREMLDNQPYGTAWEQLFAHTFPEGHQYHHLPIGSMEDVTAATLTDVRDFFIRHYVPSNAVLTVVGDVHAEDVLGKVDRYFGTVSAGEHPPVRDPQLLPADRPGGRMHIDDENVPLPAAYLLWPVPADGTSDCNRLQLAAHVLANAAGSRLGTELLRRQQAAVDVAAGLDRLVGGNSVFIVKVVGAESEDPKRLLDRVETEVRRFTEEPLSEDELTAAVANAEMQVLRQAESLVGRADSLSHGMCLFDDPDHDLATVESMRATSADEVTRAAQAWLDPSRATTLTYQPRVAAASPARPERELVR